MDFVYYACVCLLLCAGISLQNPIHSNYSEENIDYDVSFFLPPKPDVQHARIGEKKCMKQLGCFEITRDFFDSLNRPINFLPHDRASIDTKFKLYTKLHPMEMHLLDVNDPEEIEESPIDPKHKTIFIVHGFIDNTYYGKWMENLKTNLLLHGDFNVIIVDWSKGNGLPYTQATANTRVVGAEIALLIQTLGKLLGISPMDCHIIGHSLGSHVAGYAGERLKKLGRITALDPAQPYFQNMPPSVRVDPTDADFVDAIHTDSSSSKFLALGMSQPVGHVDFYPNNGMDQPGCTYSSVHSILLEGLVDAVRQFISCNHQRSVDLFIYSLNFRKALPVGHRCKNYDEYLDGRCSDCGKYGEKCAVMGMKSEQFKQFKNDSQSIKMYLSTAGSAPYWVYSYQVSVKLAKPLGFKDGPGDMYLTLLGSKRNYEFKLSTKTGDLIHGATYLFYVNKQEELGKLKGVTFKWINKSWISIKKRFIHLDYVKVTPMNIMDKMTWEKSVKKYCYLSKKAIESKENVSLAECS